MKIAIICEGKTETAFKPVLQGFLKTRLAGKMPKLDFDPNNGRIPTHEKLKRVVYNHLNNKTPADAVIAITDVYTGSQPPDFTDAADAKSKMRSWVGPEDKFYPHVALHDFEAWLLPFWSVIQKLAGSNKSSPGKNPEAVNHMKPPSYHIIECFRTGSKGKSYVKTRDALAILRDQDLLIAANACPELKAFLNTILNLCDPAAVIP